MLTAATVATMLGLSPRKVYALHAEGALPGYRFGVALRFDPADVEAYKRSLLPPAPPLIPASVLRRVERMRLRIPIEERPPTLLTAEQQAAVDLRGRNLRRPPWADAAAIQAIYAEARRLTQETGVPHDVDHIIPLQGDYVTGLHVETNLQVIARSENNRKRNRFNP